MSRTDDLIAAYRRHISLPWPRSAPGAARVIMVVYPPADERIIRLRVQELRLATEQSGHSWDLIDLTDLFAEWIGRHPHRERYFARPQLLDNAALDRFVNDLTETIAGVLRAHADDPGSVITFAGCGGLYGFAHVSRLLHRIDNEIPGRVVVLFPGEKDDSNYRLLGARDGWNYMAVGITV